MDANKTIVTKNWVLARLYEPNQVIVDCRFVLGQPEAGRQAYEQGHIPGAVYLDLEQDLSGPIAAHGGRHPLPSSEQLAERFGRAGIGPDTQVIAYDDQGGMIAARLWWLLRYLGHERALVMGDNFSAWEREGYPVTTEQHIVVPRSFIPRVQQAMLAGVDEVRRIVRDNSADLIDSRDPRRYAGLEEPLDARAGHIPGAVNCFWKQVLNEQGSWKSREELATQFRPIVGLPDDERDILVYCGSGVSACPNVLALHDLGYTKVRLYAGSWSDWISYPDSPVATGEE